MTQLSELRDGLSSARAEADHTIVDAIRPEIGGGRFTPADMRKIAERPDATTLWVSGLDQTTFEELVSLHGSQFTAVSFWKCPRIADLTPLESLPNLELVSFFWNQRATRLWDLTKTPDLTGLRLEHFTRLHDLADLALGTSLVELAIQDGVWPACVFETLDPLAELRDLRSLEFGAKRIEDGRVEPLGALRGLRSLVLRPGQFTIAQLAWLRARLPDSLQSRAVEPIWDMQFGDVTLNGKGGRHLDSARDAKRIQKHVDGFNRMVAEFRANPDLLAD